MRFSTTSMRQRTSSGTHTEDSPSWRTRSWKAQTGEPDLVEANPLDILRAAGDQAHYDMFGEMTKVYFAEFEAGKPDAARHVIDFYAGGGTFDALPQKHAITSSRRPRATSLTGLPARHFGRRLPTTVRWRCPRS